MSAKCRLCLFKTEPENSTNIFTTAKTGQLLSEIIANFASVQIEKDDGLPSLLCGKCEEKVNIVIEFWDLITTSDSLLRKKECWESKTSENQPITKEEPAWHQLTEELVEVKTESDQPLSSNDELVTCNVFYICDICHEECANEISLSEHKSEYHEDKPFKCDNCEKSYKLQASLVRHVKLDHSGATFQCDICEAIFDGYSLMHQHRRIHITASGPIKRYPSKARKRNRKSRTVRIQRMKEKFLAAIKTCDKRTPLLE